MISTKRGEKKLDEKTLATGTKLLLPIRRTKLLTCGSTTKTTTMNGHSSTKHSADADASSASPQSQQIIEQRRDVVSLIQRCYVITSQFDAAAVLSSTKNRTLYSTTREFDCSDSIFIKISSKRASMQLLCITVKTICVWTIFTLFSKTLPRWYCGRMFEAVRFRSSSERGS